MQMIPARIDAIVASAFNVKASVADPALRERFPSGCRPADAAKFDAPTRAALLSWYAENADERTSLYTRDEARRALTAHNLGGY